MAEVSEPYLRDQLEKRREELASVSSAEPAVAPFLELLQEVDSAIHRMDEGVFGVCEVCDGTVEKERLIADPLVRVCLDCLTDVEKRALEQDLELASRIQRTLLPAASTRFRDWQIHYEYRSAGMVSGDYCDLILPRERERESDFPSRRRGGQRGSSVAADDASARHVPQPCRC